MQNAVNQTAYFNESSEAMGTPQSHHEAKQLQSKQQQEPALDSSQEDDVAPGPGDTEPNHQRTLITLVTAPTARKQ